VLFGLLGAFMVAAAWRPAWRSAALAAGALSVLSFLALSLVVGDVNAALSRVVLVDAFAAAALALAALLQAMQRR
jgi:predicted phage tail protein